jgi:hypothetical protein
LWSETYFAADAEVLTAATLQTIAPEQLATLVLPLHPAARIAWLPHSAVTIWQHNRPPATPPDALEVVDVEQGVLLSRPQGAIEMLLISRAEHDFLQHLRDGMVLGEAAAIVLEQHPDADIAAGLARMIQAGTFTALSNS